MLTCSHHLGVQGEVTMKSSAKTAFAAPVVAVLALAGVTTAHAATAPVARTQKVGEVPAGYTPWLLKTTASQYVRQFVQCGDTMYAVGTISDIGQGSNTYTRGNAFSFSATTGAVTAWDPHANARVYSIALSPDCSTAYLGGSFTSLNGVPANHIAAVDTTTGAIKPEFAHNANSEVNTVLYTRGMLLVGGTFSTINDAARTKLASLDPSTGAVTSYANISITGAYRNTYTRIYKVQLSHSGDRLLAEGVFTSIDGQARRQLAMFDLGASSLSLDPWYSNEFNRHCRPAVGFYARTGAWSTDDKTVYVGTTGHKPPKGPGSSFDGPRAGPCDAAIAFPSTPTSVHHTWINYTGCDSLYAIVADGNHIYVTGHERWADNAFACESAGPGYVSRPGVAELNATTGLATDWNPTRSLGYGGDYLLVTDAGLWIGSDNYSDGLAQMCGGQTNHGGICFLPNVAAKK
jgi:hypothetical protein